MLEQNRYDLAEQELRAALIESPHDPMLHALLAVALTGQERKSEALDEARIAVSNGPDEGFCHYVLATVLHADDREKEARAAVEEALRFRSDDPDCWGLLASIHASKQRWSDVLDAAEHGLAIDAENERCVNLRAMALVYLNRRDEAGQAIDSALERDPHSAVTHANMGWTLMHQNNPAGAMEHFREALRIDPTLEWARRGIVEALKARNIIYRGLLAYSFWLSRLDSRVRIGVIIGLIVLMQVIARIPATGVWSWVILGVILAYFVFVVTVWTANPLFNLLLRLDRVGKLALNDEEKRDSTWMGLGLVVISVLVGTSLYEKLFGDAIGYLMLAVPVGVTLGTPRAARRKFAAAITFGLFAAACVQRVGWATFEWPEFQTRQELAKYVEAHPEFVAFLERQRLLGRVVVWGSAGMSWIAPIFGMGRRR